VPSGQHLAVVEALAALAGASVGQAAAFVLLASEPPVPVAEAVLEAELAVAAFELFVLTTHLSVAINYRLYLNLLFLLKYLYLMLNIIYTTIFRICLLNILKD
jgi:hypothetical protein